MYDNDGRAEMAYFERQGDHGNAELDRIAESLRDENTDPVCEACGDTGRVRCPHQVGEECTNDGTPLSLNPCPKGHGWNGVTGDCTVPCPDCPTCTGCGDRLTRANLEAHRSCSQIP